MKRCLEDGTRSLEVHTHYYATLVCVCACVCVCVCLSTTTGHEMQLHLSLGTFQSLRVRFGQITYSAVSHYTTTDTSVCV